MVKTNTPPPTHGSRRKSELHPSPGTRNSDFTDRFTGRAEDYSKYRPGYPRRIITILETEIGLNKRWEIADVGSGTGILSKIFLRHGNRVFGVEPNDEMRQSAERSLGKLFPNFVSVSGKAEATGLASHSVDLVVVAQALHWFDVDRARRELARIVKRNGYVAVIYNHRRKEGKAEAAYSDLIHRYARKGATVPEAGDELVEKFFRRGLRDKFVVPNSQTLGLEGLLGRLASASYMPQKGSREWKAIEGGARQMLREHGRNDSVVIHYDTSVYLGRVSMR